MNTTFRANRLTFLFEIFAATVCLYILNFDSQTSHILDILAEPVVYFSLSFHEIAYPETGSVIDKIDNIFLSMKRGSRQYFNI